MNFDGCPTRVSAPGPGENVKDAESRKGEYRLMRIGAANSRGEPTGINKEEKGSLPERL